MSEGIEIEYIPPYSPELNPVERVFQDIKKHIKNKKFNIISILKGGFWYDLTAIIFRFWYYNLTENS